MGGEEWRIQYDREKGAQIYYTPTNFPTTLLISLHLKLGLEPNICKFPFNKSHGSTTLLSCKSREFLLFQGKASNNNTQQEKNQKKNKRKQLSYSSIMLLRSFQSKSGYNSLHLLAQLKVNEIWLGSFINFPVFTSPHRR